MPSLSPRRVHPGQRACSPPGSIAGNQTPQAQSHREFLIPLLRWKSLGAHRKSSDLPSGDSLCEGIVSHRKRYSSHFPSLPCVVWDQERANPWMLSCGALSVLGWTTWRVSSIARLGCASMSLLPEPCRKHLRLNMSL